MLSRQILCSNESNRGLLFKVTEQSEQWQLITRINATEHCSIFALDWFIGESRNTEKSSNETV